MGLSGATRRDRERGVRAGVPSHRRGDEALAEHMAVKVAGDTPVLRGACRCVLRTAQRKGTCVRSLAQECLLVTGSGDLSGRRVGRSGGGFGRGFVAFAEAGEEVVDGDVEGVGDRVPGLE
ncbi:hypothetical protein GCM10010231_55600 [Streptomyces sindenensis]|nr:hypothetical protein GCM10010231_55600 [Streptomyces sindenensis]